jgi:D-aminopeptidase
MRRRHAAAVWAVPLLLSAVPARGGNEEDVSVDREGVAGVVTGDDVNPYRLKEPVDLELRFKHYRPGDMLAYLPGIERVDAHAIRFRARDVMEVSRFLEFVTSDEPDLSP